MIDGLVWVGMMTLSVTLGILAANAIMRWTESDEEAEEPAGMEDEADRLAASAERPNIPEWVRSRGKYDPTRRVN